MRFGKWARGLAAGIGLFAASEGMAAGPNQSKSVEVAGKSILVDKDGLIAENDSPDTTSPDYNHSQTEVIEVTPAELRPTIKNRKTPEERIAEDKAKMDEIYSRLAETLTSEPKDEPIGQTDEKNKPKIALK